MKKSHYIVLFIGLVLTAVLFLLPRTQQDRKVNAATPLDLKVEEAVRIVQSGENPMQGVMMLRAVLAENPEHLEATYSLGMLSMQSNQYEKAIERFKRVLELDANRTEVWQSIGQAYEGLEENIKAITAYRSFLKYTDDVKAKSALEERIKQLENN
jgi:tetratricopeptide (TPR) repeat protein